jgi:hypothetical protein
LEIKGQNKTSQRVGERRKKRGDISKKKTAEKEGNSGGMRIRRLAARESMVSDVILVVDL